MVLRSAWVSLRFFLLLRLIISRLPTQDKRQTLVELFISVNSTKNTTKPRQSKAKPQLNLPSLRFLASSQNPVILSNLLWLFPHPLHFEEFVCFDVSHPSLCWDCCKVVSFIFFRSFFVSCICSFLIGIIRSWIRRQCKLSPPCITQQSTRQAPSHRKSIT